MPTQHVIPDGNWEKKFAPKITGRQVAVAAAAFVIWLLFLLALAIWRWSGSLL